MNRRSKSWKKTDEETFAMTSHLRTQIRNKFLNNGCQTSRP